MTMPVSVRVDDKGRISLPREVRESLDVQPGTTLFLQQQGSVLQLAKAINPFDALASQAIHEFEQGETQSVEEVAAELGIDLSE